MEVTFQLTSDDYLKILQYQLRRAAQSSPLRFLPIGWGFLNSILLGVGGMFLYRYASEFDCTNDRRLIWGLWFALAGVIMLALAPYVSGFIYKRVLFPKDGFFCSPQTLMVEDSHLFHRCSATESKIAWSDVLAVEEDQNYLYIFLDRGLSIPIPRRSFQDRSAYHQFMSALSSHVSQKRHMQNLHMQNLYEAILGEKNRIYYLTKFESFDQQGPGLKASWNWPALLAGGGWALYRKMYGWFFAWCGITALSNIFEKAGSPGLSAIIFLVPSIAFGVYANSLYHNSIKKKIAVAQLEIKDESKLLEYLRYKGGVHTWVIWVFGGLPVIVVLAAILISMFERH